MELNMEANDNIQHLHSMEEENHLFHRHIKPHEVMTITVIGGEYCGYPTLTFEGTFRRFTLGMKKLRALKQLWPEVESFLQRHAKRKPGQGSTHLKRNPLKASEQSFTADEDVKI